MQKKNLRVSERGFSLIELMIVVILISAIITFAIMSTPSKQLFAADNQAFAIMDILQEARQRALTQGSTFRVELNDSKKEIRLIDENYTLNAADDEIIKVSYFDSATTVGTKPANVSVAGGVAPQSNAPIPEVQYVQTTYPLSANDKVQTLRFLKSGEVVDDGTDNQGDGAVTNGATIYVYNGAKGSKSSVVRAITVSGVTAATELLKCKTNGQGACASWSK